MLKNEKNYYKRGDIEDMNNKSNAKNNKPELPTIEYDVPNRAHTEMKSCPSKAENGQSNVKNKCGSNKEK